MTRDGFLLTWFESLGPGISIDFIVTWENRFHFLFKNLSSSGVIFDEVPIKGKALVDQLTSELEHYGRDMEYKGRDYAGYF